MRKIIDKIFGNYANAYYLYFIIKTLSQIAK